MEFPNVFICAGTDYSTFTHFVPAPYLRRAFTLKNSPRSCRLLVSGLGFYRVWINGTEITKGLLAPYISNPDHLVYFDRYELAPYLAEGENVLGFQLGNGMQNAPGGTVWDFQKAAWRSAPKLSFAVDIGAVRILEADETVKTASSPVLFDDLRCGVRYDARKEIPGWNKPGFDDGGWANALIAEAPKGEKRICGAEPILPTGRVLRPVSVKPAGIRGGYDPHKLVKDIPADKEMSRTGLLFDFGENNAGIVRLKMNGFPGQKIELQFAEFETDGDIDYNFINFYPDGFSQRDVYICAGGEAVFEPPFTYHGFRYCLVSGLTPEQVKDDVLEYIVCSSAIPACGYFRCSDETANTLYEMAERSDRANFWYFPTDCPHREKNGWTGDAALSAQHMLMTMACEKSYVEWMRNIRAAQKPDGSIPGIVPTFDWGYTGCGPSWDAVITEIPSWTHYYTGNTQILEESADAIDQYLRFASGKRNADGLVDYGLGDWCPVGGVKKVCTEFTNSVSLMHMALNASEIFCHLQQPARQEAAESLYIDLTDALRKKYIDQKTCVAESGSQTAQAMALYYGLFEERELDKARQHLVNSIHENGDFLDVGILGARCLFRVLTQAGEAELAYKMITRPEYPSYGHFIEAGLTALPECFELRTVPAEGGSACHHMFGDIKGWFISDVAGLEWWGPRQNILIVRPNFISKLTFAEAGCTAPGGEELRVRWERQGEDVLLTVSAPRNVHSGVVLPKGWELAEPKPKESSYTVRVIRK